MRDAQVLGVVTEGEEGPRVAYLNAVVPVTEVVLATTAPLPPTMVLRFAATCEAGKCTHFDGTNCKLASRIVAAMEPAVDKLPACTIRRTCRWFEQEGAAACMRCPRVTTLADLSDGDMRYVASGVETPPESPSS